MTYKFMLLPLVLLGLSSCAYYNEKNPPDPNTITDGSVNWSRISNEFFQTRCVLCHGSAGDSNFETYSGVLKHLSRIQQEIARGNMPPDSPLTAYEQKLLTIWVQDGEPQ